MSIEQENKTEVNLQRRKILTGATGVVGAAGATFLAVPFVSSWQPSEKAKAAGAPVNADISQMQPGQMLTVAWRGKPVWIVRRTPDMLKTLPTLDGQLRDPESAESIQPSYCQNELRAVKDEYLVVVGVCTHLGCAPLYRPAIGSPDVGTDWQGGFFCPCHGSRFDLAGRVFQSVPAPTNLEIPPYHFVSEQEIRIGEDPKEGGTA
ncbi:MULTISPECIES: ubiquinol-cytochrome c reductase iron-sulfur subunit [Thiomicrorhabdus]|uniref:Ubiquinol-cytochrome c reductase iron-sulfur subunit n=1 Tax=Thiomicrorhabdus heinhorstiae TaxID=2748010 RepID=A0ABS0BVX0_9GAMM|nr:MULTISPECIES: ubiquinol-cytochrome c reductase iron-sulfur subunit [Thiomicrorhabdus]MBF6057215.1 ubiquinol-cytochrome c reductase iron-sulfur subunit [Thiomicrorhabdus heinhorstiae]